MASIVHNGARVQAWQDESRNRWHLVGFTQEPNKLLCKPQAMWNYTPRFVTPDEISCTACRRFLE